MKLLGTAFFLLAALCVCALGQAEIPHTTVNALVSTLKSVVEAVTTSPSRVTALQSSVSTTTTVKATTVSVTTGGSTPPPTTATQRTTKGTTVQLPAEVTPTARNEDDNTTSTAQVSGTQATQNESVGAPSTKGSTLSPTTSPQKATSASETSDLHVSTPTEPANLDFVITKSNSGNTKMPEDTIHYSSVILPIVITLIVITLSVFSLVALYRMCHKKTPERQENGTEQAQSDKEGVKLLSVKTTSPETVFVEARDIFEVGFSLPSANLSELTAPPPAGEVSQGRTAGKGGYVGLAAPQLPAHG
ncbi:endomucin isoform X2 [Cygnus olor]|uniref:endomucin isoform X2 n=1 Tax=Cygnus olor TaxID=8869 RepID=UPI001ADE5922|nr:endomucin isoform X2 [Cygnus olor]